MIFGVKIFVDGIFLMVMVWVEELYLDGMMGVFFIWGECGVFFVFWCMVEFVVVCGL